MLVLDLVDLIDWACVIRPKCKILINCYCSQSFEYCVACVWVWQRATGNVHECVLIYLYCPCGGRTQEVSSNNNTANGMLHYMKCTSLSRVNKHQYCNNVHAITKVTTIASITWYVHRFFFFLCVCTVHMTNCIKALAKKSEESNQADCIRCSVIGSTAAIIMMTMMILMTMTLIEMTIIISNRNNQNN